MSYLQLSDPTTNSCEYKINLSSDFNTDYYIEVRITSTNYGSSTSSISRYVASEFAPSSGTSNYVRGEITDGISAGRTYTLYAYAQAANGTWYLAGSDTITLLDESDGEEYDYGFASVEVTTNAPYNIGDEIRIVAEVRNYENTVGPSYTVEVRDKDDNLLDSDSESELDGDDDNNAFLYPTLEASHVENGKIEYTIKIVADDAGWVDTDDHDNEEVVEIEVEGFFTDGDDDFATATELTLGTTITGTIDQDNDQDYYVVGNIPSEADIFYAIVDCDVAGYDGTYNCDVYIYGENENLIGRVAVNDGETAYIKVPIYEDLFYVRVDFDGDFVASDNQGYNLTTGIVVTTKEVEQTNQIATAVDLEVNDHIIERIKGDEKDYYRICLEEEREVTIVLQPDNNDDEYTLTLMDKNENVLDDDSGTAPLKVTYTFEKDEEYFIEVAPEVADSFNSSAYLLYIEPYGVGGVLQDENGPFVMRENIPFVKQVNGKETHEYRIEFDNDGDVVITLERLLGDFEVKVEFSKTNGSNLYTGYLNTGTTDILSFEENVQAGVEYSVEVTILNGTLNGTEWYELKCQCLLENALSQMIHDYLAQHSELTDMQRLALNKIATTYDEQKICLGASLGTSYLDTSPELQYSNDTIMDRYTAGETLLFVMEGCGTYTNGNNPNHPEGRYGALTIVVKNKSIVFLENETSSIPDYVYKEDVISDVVPTYATMIDEGVYAAGSVFHHSLVALRLCAANYLDATERTRSAVIHTRANGINFHNGYNTDSPTAPTSAGCLIVSKGHATEFFVAVGNLCEGYEYTESAGYIDITCTVIVNRQLCDFNQY